MASYGDVLYLTRHVHPQCPCFSSGLGAAWNAYFHNYANKPAAGLKLFEGALWPVVPQSQLVIRRRLGGMPILKRQPQCCPTGWSNAREVLVHTVAQCCFDEAGPSCAVEPVLLFLVPPSGLILAGY